MSLLTLLQEAAGVRNQDEVRLLICDVNSVDLDNRLCNVTTVTGTASVKFNAQLSAGVSDGFIAEPEIDSQVFVLFSKYTKPFVLMYSDLISLSIKGGEFGGLVKVIELTTKINNLENKVNDIILAYNTLSLPVSGSTAGPPVSQITPALTLTVRADIENTTIKHGES